MKHIIQVLVENKFGILARVASLFSARGYNIDSLNVGETQDATISAMTIVVDAPDERILEQIKKQLNKLIDVIEVVDFTRREHIERELIFVKISREAKEEGVISKLIKDNKLSVVANGGSDCILLACVDRQSEEEILRELKKIGIKELVRTGKAAIRK
jgi:acetolactate synthase-1/3 small subunit